MRHPENKRLYNKRSGVVYEGVERSVRRTEAIQEKETEPSLPFEFLYVPWWTKQ